MADPHRLALSVTHADGRVTRWGPDEVDAANVPGALSFSTSIPGGFKGLDCMLLRSGNSYDDQNIFDNVRAYGPGNETAWDGRQARFPRELDDALRVRPSAVGWASHLRDDASFREIYVDRDLTKWGGPSVQRQLNLVGAGRAMAPTLQPDATTGQPSLKTSVTGAWLTTTRPFVEGSYDSGGIPLGSLYYAWKIDANISPADGNWSWATGLSVDDVYSALDSSGSLRAAGPGSGTLTATTANRFFALAQLSFAAVAGGAANAELALYWTCLALYGLHGLTKQGAGSATTAPGFLLSDVVANIVSRAAPLLTFTTGAGGSIEPHPFVVPHMVFADPVTGEDAVMDANKYALNEWGVYDNREFFWRGRDPDRLTWRARLGDGARFSFEGDDAENVFNAVFVVYQDPNGRRSTVGPPGTYADHTDASLVDTDPANLATAAGIPRRCGKIEVSTVTTLEAATVIGQVWLAEHKLPSRRGELNVTGLVEHPTMGRRPAWALRAGDYVDVIDRPDEPPRYIIETDYTHDQRQNKLSLDQTIFKLESLMERMGIGLIGVI